jgi:hypothetical protein
VNVGPPKNNLIDALGGETFGYLAGAVIAVVLMYGLIQVARKKGRGQA